MSSKNQSQQNDSSKARKTSNLNAKCVEGEPNYDRDDGCTCSICWNSWETSGEHRLVSLRCGHLFGDSCIRRWLAECKRQTGVKKCPQCKKKVSLRDIRYLYAKRIRSIHQIDEYELQKLREENQNYLEGIETELNSLKVNHEFSLKKIKEQKLEIERLKTIINSCPTDTANEGGNNSKSQYKLLMECILIFQASEYRVMAYTKKHNSILVTQKISNSLHPGFGIYIITVPTFEIQQYVHLTTNMICDISLSNDQQTIACASMEPCIKLYDFQTRDITMITASKSGRILSACTMDGIQNEFFLYAGTEKGSVITFDKRFPNTIVSEYKPIDDFSPVISIVVVTKTDDFPHGGICVCKLNSIWFYEFTSDSLGSAIPTRLLIEGPSFISINYEKVQSLLIVTTGISDLHPQSKFIIGKLIKTEHRPYFHLQTTFFGSKTMPIISRNCLISIELSTLFAAYIEETKKLAIFDVHRQKCIQTIPIDEIVHDICPIYTIDDTFLAALTEKKCRIFKLNES